MTAVIIPLTAVNAAAEKIKISRTNAEVPVGYSITVKVTGASDVKWFSDNESVASVKADGSSAKIYGKKTGSASISAKVGKTTLKCKVTVKKSFITPSAETVEIENGQSKTVTVKVTGSKDISMSNSDKKVCSASWGKWDGDKIKLTIKSKSEGKSVIRIYAKDAKDSTAASITVISKDSAILIEDEDNSTNPEENVIELVNSERRAAGKTALQKDDELDAIAAARAEELAKSFSHTRPDGRSCFTAFKDAGYTDYTTAAENIAYNYNNSADDVMDIWMNSPGHKANILLDDITKIGVGCYEKDGKYYWVQVFTG